jgi:hypothetical protein
VRDLFFLVEKPGFDVALIAGNEEDIPGDGNTALDGEVHGSTEWRPPVFCVQIGAIGV